MTYTACSGADCRTIMTFTAPASTTNPLEMKSLVQQEMLKRGVLWGGFHNVSFGHSDEDVEHVIACYRQVLPILKAAVDSGTVRSMLRGEPVEPVFRKTSKFDTKPVRTA
jgi:hypothetical protein